ncbi:MAG: hypothetical protein BRD46_05885 [Bacteroidetes bacterium QS_8_68_15]|nr:MAG: hypothetical protein BRD46_05885 [Bacteroidetes bacterium QS_8_68_15]
MSGIEAQLLRADGVENVPAWVVTPPPQQMVLQEQSTGLAALERRGEQSTVAVSYPNYRNAILRVADHNATQRLPIRNVVIAPALLNLQASPADEAQALRRALRETTAKPYEQS